MYALNYFEDLLLEVGSDRHLFTAVKLSYTFRYYFIRTYVRSYTYAFCPKPNDMISDHEIDRGKPSFVDSGQFLLSPVLASSSTSSISHNDEVASRKSSW